MIRLWRKVLRPIVSAAQCKSILEIGAEYGTSTKVLLNYVKQVDGHLHCIDPVPGFDATQFQEDNKDCLSFYEDLSLNVLEDIHDVDLAMVDGDHNWYTVYHELKAIEKAHGHDPMRQPILFAHDIGWPYARRDLYYDPSNIPAEFLHEYAREGILPNKDELIPDGGMNVELCNAVKLGGERNGVLTGVEDYIKESELNYRFINLPLYYGLGILITEERLSANPALQAEISKLEQQMEGENLIALTEHLRTTEGVILQVVSRRLAASEKRVEELEAKLSACDP
ncbi:MAG: hypothetical protein ACI9B9_002622 [Halioglobus sp.]|jgi:hypothetical protein